MSAPSQPARDLKAIRDQNPYAALGRAVSYMMGKTSFASLRFGHWAQTLSGQINRNHYFFVLNGQKVVGFLGWAFVNEDLAKAWVEGKRGIAFSESKDGDCMVINAWAADDNGVNRFVLDQIRKIGAEKTRVYAKRFYKDGRVRPVILDVNDFVKDHIARKAE